MNSAIILLTIVLGQTNIPSITIQPTNEPIIVFQHAGELISVGKSTGKVTLLGNGPVTPDRPDNVNLTGLAKTIYESMISVVPPENRKPLPDEMAACMPYLRAQIELLKPKVIVLLGKAAVHSVLRDDSSLASLRGRRHEYRGIPVVVTYHPAYLLRNQPEKAKAWEDLLFARRCLREATATTSNPSL